MSQILEQPPINLIPESAPFNAEQRAWLNGFFAGSETLGRRVRQRFGGLKVY